MDNGEAAARAELKRAEKNASLAGFVVATGVIAFVLFVDDDWSLGHLVWDFIGWVIIFAAVRAGVRSSFIKSKKDVLRRREEIAVIAAANAPRRQS